MKNVKSSQEKMSVFKSLLVSNTSKQRISKRYTLGFFSKKIAKRQPLFLD